VRLGSVIIKKSSLHYGYRMDEVRQRSSRDLEIEFGSKARCLSKSIVQVQTVC
jgi:hypothetical protein